MIAWLADAVDSAITFLALTFLGLAVVAVGALLFVAILWCLIHGASLAGMVFERVKDAAP